MLTTNPENVNNSMDEKERPLNSEPSTKGLKDLDNLNAGQKELNADSDTLSGENELSDEDLPFLDSAEDTPNGDATEVVKRIPLTPAEKSKVFEKEFYPHITALYNFAFRLTLQEDDANDLVQDTYLKAFRFIDSYLVGTNAKAWLFKILKNSFINNFRRKTKQPEKVDYESIEPPTCAPKCSGQWWVTRSLAH
jgi:hypothetical protein